MKDIIYRQAAIDFIDAGHLCNPNEPRWSDNEVVNFLKSRPSAQPKDYDYSDGYIDGYKQGQKDAQPDIIHCGECKYYHDSDGCFFSTATTGADGFCHWAERKEGEANEAD